MNTSLLIAMGLAVTVAGIFAYSAIRWRRSPRVFKAMNYVALLSLLVGIAIGALATRAIIGPRPAGPRPAETAHGASAPAATLGAGPVEVKSTAGIPVGDVSKALVGTQLEHLMDGTGQPWSSVAQDCRLGRTDPHSLRCEAAFIYDDPHGYHGEWKDHTEVVPYTMVLKFCDAGWADKDSKVCLAASRFGSKSG